MNEDIPQHNQVRGETGGRLCRVSRCGFCKALTCWQVEEYERSATAESRREARIAAVRAIILGGMMNGTTCSPRRSAILTVG